MLPGDIAAFEAMSGIGDNALNVCDKFGDQIKKYTLLDMSNKIMELAKMKLKARKLDLSKVEVSEKFSFVCE